MLVGASSLTLTLLLRASTKILLQAGMMLLTLLNLRRMFGMKFGKQQVALVLVYFIPSKSQVNQGLILK